mgnify:CR=1 FL=1
MLLGSCRLSENEDDDDDDDDEDEDDDDDDDDDEDDDDNGKSNASVSSSQSPSTTNDDLTSTDQKIISQVSIHFTWIERVWVRKGSNLSKSGRWWWIVHHSQKYVDDLN